MTLWQRVLPMVTEVLHRMTQGEPIHLQSRKGKGVYTGLGVW